MIGDGTEGGTGTPSVLTETPAADYCENPNHGESVARPDSGTATCCPALYIQGELYPAFLGAISQWTKGVRDNSAAILAIQRAILCNGIDGRPAAVNFASGSWWSSSQRNATNSWNLNNGSLNNNNKTNTYNALPFYEIQWKSKSSGSHTKLFGLPTRTAENTSEIHTHALSLNSTKHNTQAIFGKT